MQRRRAAAEEGAQEARRVGPRGRERAAAAAALDGRVFVAGGTTAEGNTGATWAYDLATRRWSASAPLPAALFNHAAVALDGTLYGPGGYPDAPQRGPVYAYEPGPEPSRRADANNSEYATPR